MSDNQVKADAQSVPAQTSGVTVAASSSVSNFYKYSIESLDRLYSKANEAKGIETSDDNPVLNTNKKSLLHSDVASFLNYCNVWQQK